MKQEEPAEAQDSLANVQRGGGGGGKVVSTTPTEKVAEIDTSIGRDKKKKKNIRDNIRALEEKRKSL